MTKIDTLYNMAASTAIWGIELLNGEDGKGRKVQVTFDGDELVRTDGRRLVLRSKTDRLELFGLSSAMADHPEGVLFRDPVLPPNLCHRVVWGNPIFVKSDRTSLAIKQLQEMLVEEFHAPRHPVHGELAGDVSDTEDPPDEDKTKSKSRRRTSSDASEAEDDDSEPEDDMGLDDFEAEESDPEDSDSDDSEPEGDDEPEEEEEEEEPEEEPEDEEETRHETKRKTSKRGKETPKSAPPPPEASGRGKRMRGKSR